MLKFEYSVQLNDDGRPYIHFPKDYKDNPEDKFLALELTRYLFTGIYARRRTEFTPTDVKGLEVTLDMLEKVSDEIAAILKQQMEVMGEVELNFHRNYHVQVETIEERDKLNYEGIIYNEKIFKREAGLKVLVFNEQKIYELVDGKDNEHWKEIK